MAVQNKYDKAYQPRFRTKTASFKISLRRDQIQEIFCSTVEHMEMNCSNFKYLTLPVFYGYYYYPKMDEVHVAQTFTSEIAWLTVIKNVPETSAIFTGNTLISFRRNKAIRKNLIRNVLKHNLLLPVPFHALAFVVTRVRSFNSATSISGPKSNFVIWHNFNVICCISYSKYCKL